MSEGIVTINVGKRGINDNLINEINTLLEKRGAVKVKLLRNFRQNLSGSGRKELAMEIAEKINGRLVDLRGFVLTFKRC